MRRASGRKDCVYYLCSVGSVFMGDANAIKLERVCVQRVAGKCENIRGKI